MNFVTTAIPGLFIIETETNIDERGMFARTFCRQEFVAHGLNPMVDQCNLSVNRSRGILRGLHYQTAPHSEAKLVRCIRGAIFDVAVDLRSDSPAYCRWFGMELNAENHVLRSLYIPEGVAHGFQTLLDDTWLYYQMSHGFHPENSRGVRWDDPLFGISWPVRDPIVSEKDRGFADFRK